MALINFSNANKPNLKPDLFVDLMKKGWITVLSDSAIKLLIYFSYIKGLGGALIGDYNEITRRTGMARASISKGLLELETFGFIYIRKKIGKTKLYELCNSVVFLNSDWKTFFSKKSYKKISIDILNGMTIANQDINKMYCDVEANKDTYLIKTLGKLLYLYTNKSNFDVNDLISEELCELDEILFTDKWSYGEINDEKNNWIDLLTDEEKNNKNFMKIVESFVANVNIPNEEDITYIRKAYAICYPYQIVAGIISRKRHPVYGSRFVRFKYLYSMLKKGMYGTRTKKKINDDL